MKKNIYKQLILFITVIAVFFVNLVSVYCSAASTVNFSIENIDNVDCSKSVNVTVKVNCEQPITLNGFSIYLTFPEEQIEYVNGSAKSNISGIEGVTVYCSEGRVYFVWESDEAVTVSTGKFATFTFNTSGNFSGAIVQLTVESMYYTAISGGKLVFNDISFSPLASGMLNAKSADTVVQDVIQLINNIGTVTFTDECKQKIDTAYNAYLNLSLSQRENVTNYNTLTKAIKLYDQLKQSADYDASDEEVEKFLSEHASVLSLSLNNVTLNDLKGIEDALNDLKNLSVVAQSRLARQKYQLNSLLEKAKELASGLEEEKKQQQLREEAEKLANEFRNNLYSWTLKLTPQTVTVDDETGVRAMLEELDGVAIMNDLAYEMLAPEKALLDSLLEQIEKLLILESPEDAEYIKEANRFKNNYSYILNLAPTEVTADDELYITIAYEVYNMLNDKTKSYLTNEGKILKGLLDAVSNIPSEEDDSEIIDSDNSEEVIEKEKIVYREASGKDYLVKFSNKKLSKTVWIMIILAVAACLNTAVIYVYSLCYKRKINSIVNNAVEERRGDI
ncbi:MAG: hypothetical protein II201_00055 [Clostridia bacterium]|nr:hypothetical protein [Clostridia bacterium]